MVIRQEAKQVQTHYGPALAGVSVTVRFIGQSVKCSTKVSRVFLTMLL